MRTRKRNRSKKNKLNRRTKNRRRTRRGGTALPPLQLCRSDSAAGCLSVTLSPIQINEINNLAQQTPDAVLSPHPIIDILTPRPPSPTPRTQTQQRVGPYKTCEQITSSTFWPNHEGCDIGSMKLTTIQPGDIIDRIGFETGGYFAKMDEYGKPYSYLKRSMKTYSATNVCMETYLNSIDTGKFNYHQYQLTEKARGINVLECNALFPEWIEKLVAQGQISEENKALYTGAKQIIFLIPDEVLFGWYGKQTSKTGPANRRNAKQIEKDYNDAILNDRPQKVLLDYPWTRFEKDKDGNDTQIVSPTDKSSIHLYTDEQGKAWKVFTVKGLINSGFIDEISITAYPSFIEPGKESLLS